MLKNYNLFRKSLMFLPNKKSLINTINANAFNVAQTDRVFQLALQKSVLLPDGISIVWATQLLSRKLIQKIAGNDLFLHEMMRLEKNGGSCFFLGSSEEILKKIVERSLIEYPNIKVGSYSPPYKVEFTDNENASMIEAVNAFSPDVLFIGMTAPKQEKWAFKYYDQLQTGHICCIGAVFDFYAGTVKRAPKWIIKLGFEWLYRLLKEPRRMWKRYLFGNTKFIYYIISELFSKKNSFKF